tara:strand:- start:13909 stop:14277 length:369 start_codon:yes stop_codon:yes gene_type:complete
MKQLISLLLTILITIISWSTFAKSTVIQVNSLYVQPSLTTSSILLKPYLSTQHINENFALTSSKTMNKHNVLFESTMIFNDKLQQFIAFFTRSNNEIKEVANNNLSTSKKSKPTIQKCSASS